MKDAWQYKLLRVLQFTLEGDVYFLTPNCCFFTFKCLYYRSRDGHCVGLACQSERPVHLDPRYPNLG